LYCNISQYYCFTVFAQINAAMGSVKDFFEKQNIILTPNVLVEYMSQKAKENSF